MNPLDSMFDALPSVASTKQKLNIDVILDDMSKHKLLVRQAEDAPPMWISRHGVVLSNLQDMTESLYATLTLTESRAISYNLI